MAEGDCTVYQSFIRDVLSGKINCTSDSFHITLHNGLHPDRRRTKYGLMCLAPSTRLPVVTRLAERRSLPRP